MQDLNYSIISPLTLSLLAQCSVVVIGYINPIPCRTSEGEEEGLVVQFGILFGQLATNLTLQFDTSSRSAIGNHSRDPPLAVNYTPLFGRGMMH